MDFHVLYEQIWLSEQKAQERKTLLNEVKNEISNVQKQILETKESGLLLKGQLSHKLRCLSKEEENVVWLSRRHETLEEKLDTIMKQKNEHQQRLETLQESNKEERSKFISEVTAFSKSYELCGKGQEERQTAAKQHVEELKKQQEQLETDIAMLMEQQVAVTKEEERKTGLKKEVEGLKSKLQSLVQTHDNQKAKTKQLELTKMQVSNKPQTDPEFKRQRAELESCQDDTMQGVCQALQQELDRLQRQRWQQQVQKRQQPLAQQNPFSKGGQSNLQARQGWNNNTTTNNKKIANTRPYQISNNPASNINRPTGSQLNITRPISSHPSTSAANPSISVQSASSAPSTVKSGSAVGKFKPNLAKLRRAVEQQHGASTQQNQQLSSSSTATHPGPTPPKQAKKVRFDNSQWK